MVPTSSREVRSRRSNRLFIRRKGRVNRIPEDEGMDSDIRLGTVADSDEFDEWGLAR